MTHRIEVILTKTKEFWYEDDLYESAAATLLEAIQSGEYPLDWDGVNQHESIGVQDITFGGGYVTDGEQGIGNDLSGLATVSARSIPLAAEKIAIRKAEIAEEKAEIVNAISSKPDASEKEYDIA